MNLFRTALRISALLQTLLLFYDDTVGRSEDVLPLFPDEVDGVAALLAAAAKSRILDELSLKILRAELHSWSGRGPLIREVFVALVAELRRTEYESELSNVGRHLDQIRCAKESGERSGS